MPETYSRKRARPVAPEERRRQIVEAAVELMRTHGRDITSRQIAQAAQVAEGTLFSVFASKEEILDCAIRSVLYDESRLEKIRQFDRTLPLRERLYELAELNAATILAHYDFLQACGIVPSLSTRDDDVKNAYMKCYIEAFTELVGEDRDQLDITLPQFQRLFDTCVYASVHPLVTGGDVTPARVVVDRLLDGVLATS
ncbi:TetR/AcrR family transcriptional regulator [Devriesea agamarum]|uniref:TetR/AcrR family transcriptional regulator n=1 Tax=Devriesea agamarum TaxID=472569 RepID=UPI00071D8C2C|nr:TetR/AcrR family transcriptional regulator [Devriesea agamarum]